MERKMDLMEIIYDMAHNSRNLNVREQASALGVKYGNFSNMLNPEEDGFHYRLQMLVPHMLMLNDLRPLHYLASKTDQVLLPLPKTPADLENVQVEMNRLVKEIGDVFQRIGMAMDARGDKGASISMDEAKSIEKEINEALPQMLALLRSVQDAAE